MDDIAQIDGTWSRAVVGLRNARLNIQAGLTQRGSQLFDIELSKAQREADTVIVIGSGPSAMRYQSQLPEIANGRFVICGPTSLGWFRYYSGRYPDMIANVDVSDQLYQPLADVLDIDGPIPPIAAPPEVDHEIAKRFAQWIHWFLYLPHDSKQGLDKHPYAHFVRCLFAPLSVDEPEPGTVKYGLAQMGSISNTMVAIADRLKQRGVMSQKRIVLMGCDHAQVDGYGRLPRVKRIGPYGNLVIDPPPTATNHLETFEFEGFTTEIRMLLTAGNFLHYWVQETKGGPAAGIVSPVYLLGDGLLKPYVPNVTVDQLLKGRYPRYISLGERLNRRDAMSEKIKHTLENLGVAS